MEHKYQCLECRAVFSEPKNYKSDPNIRKCIACGKGKGRIAYLGCGKRALQLIMDSMPAIKSMSDGKTYDSKTQYYESLKRNGSRIIEKGEYNPEKTRELQGDFNCREDLKKALQQHLH